MEWDIGRRSHHVASKRLANKVQSGRLHFAVQIPLVLAKTNILQTILAPRNEVGHLTLHHAMNVGFADNFELFFCSTKNNRRCAAWEDSHHIARTRPIIFSATAIGRHPSKSAAYHSRKMSTEHRSPAAMVCPSSLQRTRL
jgi:hypothetical protein